MSLAKSDFKQLLKEIKCVSHKSKEILRGPNGDSHMREIRQFLTVSLISFAQISSLLNVLRFDIRLLVGYFTSDHLSAAVLSWQATLLVLVC